MIFNRMKKRKKEEEEANKRRLKYKRIENNGVLLNGLFRK